LFTGQFVLSPFSASYFWLQEFIYICLFLQDYPWNQIRCCRCCWSRWVWIQGSCWWFCL